MKKLYQFLLIVGLMAIKASWHSSAQEGPPNANDPILLEAIETVREFLGDPNVTPLFVRDKEYRLGESITGPCKLFEFEAPGYLVITVQVDTTPMQIVEWLRNDTWILSLDKTKISLNKEQMVKIATQYVQAY